MSIIIELSQLMDEIRLHRQRALRADEALRHHRAIMRDRVTQAIELGATHDTIAGVLGVTRQRVGQIIESETQ